jgi:hypothetical protein
MTACGFTLAKCLRRTLHQKKKRTEVRFFFIENKQSMPVFGA